MNTTKILVLCRETYDVLYSKLISTNKYDPETFILYVNKYEVDAMNDLEYDVFLIEELTKLGVTLSSDQFVNVGTISYPARNKSIVELGNNNILDLRNIKSDVECKHYKPFYQKGRW